MKTPEMEAFCNLMAKATFGRSRTGTHCVCCGSDKVQPQDFRDDLSRREFGISHLCQACQDKAFGEDEA